MSNQSRLVLVQAYRLSPRVKNARSHAPWLSSHKLRNYPRHDHGVVHSTAGMKRTTERGGQRPSDGNH